MEAIIVGATIALYCLPTISAHFRGHHQTDAIFFLNLLLGWTVLGWIISIVWAFTAVKKTATDGTVDG